MKYIHVERQSNLARAMKLAMNTIGFRYRYERMLRKGKFNDVAAPLPNSFRKKYSITEKSYQNHPTWTIAPKKKSSNNVIFYLHGGGYVNNLVAFHWKFVEQLLLNTAATIVVVDYPLAPKYSHLETYRMVSEVYEDLLQTHSSNDIIFMGDSAGGGLCLGLAQVFRDENRPLPQQLVLLSPWLDMTGTNPAIVPLEPFDTLLTLKALPVNVLYAKETDLRDHRLSPLFGTFNDLPPIAIFTGTHEMLHVDSMELHNLLNKFQIKHRLYVYPKMFHVWMAVTWLKESKKVVQQIAELLK